MIIKEFIIVMKVPHDEIHWMLDPQHNPPRALRCSGETGDSRLTMLPIFSSDNESCHVHANARVHMQHIECSKWGVFLSTLATCTWHLSKCMRICTVLSMTSGTRAAPLSPWLIILKCWEAHFIPHHQQTFTVQTMQLSGSCIIRWLTGAGGCPQASTADLRAPALMLPLPSPHLPVSQIMALMFGSAPSL